MQLFASSFCLSAGLEGRKRKGENTGIVWMTESDKVLKQEMKQFFVDIYTKNTK
jgi:hypothetical protein